MVFLPSGHQKSGPLTHEKSGFLGFGPPGGGQKHPPPGGVRKHPPRGGSKTPNWTPPRGGVDERPGLWLFEKPSIGPKKTCFSPPPGGGQKHPFFDPPPGELKNRVMGKTLGLKKRCFLTPPKTTKKTHFFHSTPPRGGGYERPGLWLFRPPQKTQKKGCFWPPPGGPSKSDYAAAGSYPGSKMTVLTPPRGGVRKPRFWNSMRELTRFWGL
jgi:hypothetical protein